MDVLIAYWKLMAFSNPHVQSLHYCSLSVFSTYFLVCRETGSRSIPPRVRAKPKYLIILLIANINIVIQSWVQCLAFV